MLRKAVTHLKRSDPRLAAVIAEVGPCRFAPQREGAHVDALMRAIIYQQLSGKAASTIHSRFLALFGGRPPTPEELLGAPNATLRGAGLSGQKTRYLKDLAGKLQSGALVPGEWEALEDEELVATLVQVKGIGRWTAHMFLMFRLGRLNVLPDLDLGVRKGVQRAYKLRKLPAPKDVLRIGARWAPYASIAVWYLWRSLDTPAVARTRQGASPVARRSRKVK